LPSARAATMRKRHKKPQGNKSRARTTNDFPLGHSHHPMTCKHLPRRAIKRCRGKPCIDRGVLNMGMSEPVFHKREISTSVEQVCRNRMLQAMELSLLHWQPCNLAIRLHEMMQHIPANRHVAI